jgi:hypothetical protein
MPATITLPDNLAREAAKVGLTQAAIERLLRVEIERLRVQEEDAEEPRDWSKVSNRELIEQINAAYADEPDEEEKEFQRQMRGHQRRMLEKLDDGW